MLSAIFLAATTVLACGDAVPMVAKNYRPRPILTTEQAIIAAREQDEEFSVRRFPVTVWQRSFKAKRIGAEWVLDGKLNQTQNQIHLDAATGRMTCLWVID